MALAFTSPQSPGPDCKEAVPAPSAIHEAPPARPHLLNDLSIVHVKLDNVHMAEGTTPRGPHGPEEP